MEGELLSCTELSPELDGLLTEHLPFSLPVLRRLQFTRLKDGTTPSARILFTSELGDNALTDPKKKPRRFTVVYLDFSRGRETQMWIYSTLEDRGVEAVEKAHCEEQIVAIMNKVKAASRLYGDREPYPNAVLIGSLNSVVRDVLEKHEIKVTRRSEWDYEKWLFRTEELPAELEFALPDGAHWAQPSAEDCEVVLSRTHIPREVKTLMTLPSLSIKFSNGALAAWAFLGPDASLSSLHCEEQYRGRGLAKALTAKLFRDSTKGYGLDGWCALDVYPENLASKGVCRALKGRRAWDVSWVVVDLS